jgi:hypothetical protein
MTHTTFRSSTELVVVSVREWPVTVRSPRLAAWTTTSIRPTSVENVPA